MKTEILFRDESYKILGACFEVYNEKSNGFLESVYQDCLRKELRHQEIAFCEKPRLELYYKGEKLEQHYEPDFLLYGEIIVELKVVKTITDEHQAQVINYLRSTNLKLGLLINFGHYPRLQYERLLN